MTQKIIYHEFVNESNEPNVALTAPILDKGRRLIKTYAQVNTALNVGCIFLCGACSAVSLVILLLLVRGS